MMHSWCSCPPAFRGDLMTEPTVRDRPLSPHLQIYRPMLTMVMSITNRITGAALYFGMALLVLWLVAAARGPEAFATIQALYGSWLGLLILFGFTWALMLHTLAGIRHLIWDMGRGLDLRSVEWGAVAVLAGSIALTLALWLTVVLREAPT
jgi:succinate dehydrogenase / fumarate reductase cytochrome b subunit